MSKYSIINDDNDIIPINNIKNVINLKEFDLYTFQLKRTYKNDFDSTFEIKRPVFELRESDDDLDGIIVEELYLYLPNKNSSSNQALVLTTLSHKYLYKDAGVFNCPDFRDKKMFIEDMEKVFHGTIDTQKNEIYFENEDSSDNMRWSFKKENEHINVVSVDANKRDYITDQVFATQFKFRKQNRDIIYGKGAEPYRVNCFCAANIPQDKPAAVSSNAGVAVEKIIFGKEYIYFQTGKINDTIEAYRFENDRLIYSRKDL